jgi:DNA-binding transcriptional regulator/RsmH inhibitor MraZ
MKIITLCGSTKFKNEFELVNEKLTLLGHIVLSVGVFVHSKQIKIDSKQKVMLDQLHKKKIDLSDEIFVIDVNNYIGSSTKNEINYAIANKKKVNFYSDTNNPYLN